MRLIKKNNLNKLSFFVNRKNVIEYLRIIIYAHKRHFFTFVTQCSKTIDRLEILICRVKFSILKFVCYYFSLLYFCYMSTDFFIAKKKCKCVKIFSYGFFSLSKMFCYFLFSLIYGAVNVISSERQILKFNTPLHARMAVAVALFNSHIFNLHFSV